MITVPLTHLCVGLRFSRGVVGGRILGRTKGDKFCLCKGRARFLTSTLVPALMGRPQRATIVIRPGGISVPILKQVAPCLKTLPLPSSENTVGRFLRTLA